MKTGSEVIDVLSDGQSKGYYRITNKVSCIVMLMVDTRLSNNLQRSLAYFSLRRNIYISVCMHCFACT